MAVCTIFVQEPIVVDVFSHHRTLGELILIDRITNMTSACGVVIDTNDNNTDDTFADGELKGRGDMFEEFFYGMQSLNINKVKPAPHQYHVGDTIPVTGKTYAYPHDFDCLILRDQVAVEVRNDRIQAICSLHEYTYTGMPLINGRGFAIQVDSPAAFAQFMKEYQQTGENPDAELFETWMDFDTYRSIKFQNDF